MQKEADFQIGRAEIVVQLTNGELAQLEACLGLHNELVIHDHVYALYAQLLPFVNDSSPDLARHAMAARQKLTFQRHHVEVLKKSKSKVVVNLEKRPDHGSRESFFNQDMSRHTPRMARRNANKSSIPATQTPIATRIYPFNPSNPPNPPIILNLDA
jgi:hypothetical protein